jgi:alkylated DNA repair protein alkB family protein 7
LRIFSEITRYDFTHEILDNKKSTFDGNKIPKGRRISLICRDLPEKQVEPDLSFKAIE